MSLEKFTRADIRIGVLAVLLGFAGLWIFLRFEPVAFPEASIDFKVSRPEVERRARIFLEARGFDLGDYRQLILFEYDDNAKTYLERELGLEEANRLMASEINVWRWKVRLIKPPEKEELIVWLDPAGEIVGFEHVVEEKQPGARLSATQARNVAELFLRSRLSVDPAEYDLVEETVDERPERLDHRFTWERKGFKAKDATYRLSVSVYGAEIGRALPSLKVPERWQRDYRRLRSRNQLLTVIATLFYVPLIFAICLTLIPRVRQRQVSWKAPLWIGGTIGLLMFVARLNSLPLWIGEFSTAASFPLTVSLAVVLSALIALAQGLSVTVLAAGGEVLYREMAPQRVALSRLFSLRGLRSKELFQSTLVGYALAAMQLGFVAVFYLAAGRFGAWSPADVKYSDSLSTQLPWIYPLTIGLVAATSEEFAFRLFAIPFLKKYLKSTWLAVLIPAIVWGFLHSNYPQQPAWIRGAEVGFVGIVLGFVFLRFGILATLVAHYTYDAAVIGLLLLRSDNLYFLLSGGLVIDMVLIPLAISGALYWTHRRFSAQPEIFNAGLQRALADEAAAAAAATPPGEPAIAMSPADEITGAPSLSGRRLALAIASGGVGLGLCFLPVQQPLGFMEWRTRADDAEAVADRFLEERGADPTAWRRVTTFSPSFDAEAAEYVRRQNGIAGVNELWSTRLRSGTANWRVRYYRPLEKEEHLVRVTSDGRVASHEHRVEETAPGAELTPEEARLRAAAHLLEMHELDVSSWDLAESKVEKREARVDHHLIWQDPVASVGESHVRAEVDVIGDEVSRFRPHLKVPEEWRRELGKVRAQQIMGIVGLAALSVWLLIAGILRLPRHSFHWRLYIRMGILVAALQAVEILNGLRAFGDDYGTSVTWRIYVLQKVALGLLGVLGIGFLLAITALWATPYVPWNALQFRAQTTSRLVRVRDALVLGISALLVFRGLGTLASFVGQTFPVPQDATEASLTEGLATYLPGLDAGIDAVTSALFLLCLIGICIGVLRSHFRSLAARAGFVVVVVASLGALATVGARGFIQDVLVMLFQTAAFFLMVGFVLRTNLLAYLVWLALASLDSHLLFYWNQPAFRADSVVALLSTGLCLLIAVAVLRKSTPLHSTPAVGGFVATSGPAAGAQSP